MTRSRYLSSKLLLAFLAAGPVCAAGQTMYTIVAGESLSTVAARAYGDGRA